MKLPTPHYEKLVATLENEKLPPQDKDAIKACIEKYKEWVKQMQTVTGKDINETVSKLVALLNEYRLYLDVEVIFDREEDFLYRQKGQTKLDNSVLEEFLPHLVFKTIMQGRDTTGIALGPNTTFSSVYFASSLDAPADGGGLTVRTKDQDFAVGKCIYLKASHDADFRHVLTKSFYLGYVVAECKTNLDKTMFQEAVATAHDAKSAVTGAKYYLLCEWLDMTPQSTAPTDIDEVIILRKQKRMSSNIRSAFGTCVVAHPLVPEGNPGLMASRRSKLAGFSASQARTPGVASRHAASPIVKERSSSRLLRLKTKRDAHDRQMRVAPTAMPLDGDFDLDWIAGVDGNGVA